MSTPQKPNGDLLNSEVQVPELEAAGANVQVPYQAEDLYQKQHQEAAPTVPDEDPSSGVDLTEGYSEEDAIYNPQTLYGYVERFKQDFLGVGAQKDQKAIQSEDIRYNQELQNADPLVGNTASDIEMARGVVAGAAGSLVNISNLVNLATGTANRAIVSKLTGISDEELKAKYPNMLGDHQAEIPEWLKPLNETGKTAEGITQALMAIGGFQVLGSAEKVGEAGVGIKGAIEAVKATAANIGKTFAVDASMFDGHQENLGNILSSALTNNPGVLKDVADWVKTDENNPELENRVKNGIAASSFEVAGAVAFGAAKLFKSLVKYKNVALSEGKRAFEILKEVENDSDALNNELARVKEMDPAELMDKYLFKEHPPETSVAPAQEAASNEVSHSISGQVHVNEDGSVSIEGEHHSAQNATETPKESPAHNPGGSSTATDEGAAARQGATGKGESGTVAGETPIEIIHPDDSLGDAADKVLRAHTEVQQTRIGKNEEAIRNMIQEQGRQGVKAFDKKAFARSISDKIKSGEPVDLQQEIMNHTSTRDLTDIDTYMDNFKNILEASTTAVKRYESNTDLVSRVKSILGFDLGHEAWSRGLDGEKVSKDLLSAFESLTERGVKSLAHDEEVLLEMMALKLHSKHLIPQQMAKTLFTSFQAETHGLVEQARVLDAEVQALNAAQIESEALFDKMLSNAGRRLQAGGQAATSFQDSQEFLQTFDEARKGLPLLATGGKTLSDAELKALKVAANDHMTGGGTSVPGAESMIAKHFWAFLDATRKVGKYGVGVTQEVFYNNVLGSFDTLKSIGWSNVLLKGNELAARTTGAVMERDLESLMRAKDEAEGVIRYLTEGLSAGVTVLRTGAKDALDYTPANPRVISADGLRQYFGASLGDVVKQEVLGHNVGSVADRVIDAVGSVVNIPTKNLIGGIDTSFKVANQRGIIWPELKALARSKGLKGSDVTEYAVRHIDSVTEDLIKARATKFDPQMPLSNSELTVSQLKSLHNLLVADTDTVNLAHPLKSSPHSDRWVFRFFSKLDDLSRMTGFVGTWEMPFIKTFANSIQYGVDNSIFNWLSPHNQQIYRTGSTLERQTLKGKLLLGSAMAAAGFGAAASGLVAPLTGSSGAKKQQTQLTGAGTYTLNVGAEDVGKVPLLGAYLEGGFKTLFPGPVPGAVTLNFNKTSPLADNLFLPAKLAQLSAATVQGKMDPGSAGYAAVTMASESFSSGRFLRGAAVSMDSFLNPTYSTAENLQRNVLVGGLGSVLVPGGRGWRNITKFTDPYYRDYTNLWDYTKAQLPGLSNTVSPTYDQFGNPRPADDYIGGTNTLAVNATRLATSIGIKYVQNDPLVKEIERFGEMGQSFTVPNKNLGWDGVQFPLDRYKNAKGESLWDAYNRELSTLRLKSITGSGKDLTLREALDEFIQSPAYQEMHDNEVRRVGGKRQVLLGSRWSELYATYRMATEEARNNILNNDSYLNEYKNVQGKSLMDDHDAAVTRKEELQN